MGGRTIWAAAIARNSAKHVRDGGDGRARAGERAEDEREEEQREGGDERERTPRARSDASRAAANLSSPSHPPRTPSLHCLLLSPRLGFLLCCATTFTNPPHMTTTSNTTRAQ